MTYGVDQCRVCGVKIALRPPTMREQKTIQVANSKIKKLMTEPEWRAAGFRAQPTPYQMLRPPVGCCAACGTKLELKRQNTRFWMFVLAAAILAVPGLVVLTFTFVPR